MEAIESFLASVLPSEVQASNGAASAALPYALSPREVEVLRLIAVGKSNHQIADALVISAHTVGRHLSNIFAKIGVANRTEAAGYARDHRLT